MIISAYLAAIVLANLTVAAFGPSVVVLNAFLLIGLDLTARDVLHDRWNREGLVWKMGLLIAAGGALSWLLNHDAGPIALASTVAFATAAIVDAAIYHLIRRKQDGTDKVREFLIRVNASNIGGAGVDSVVFPTLAFGVFMPWIIAGQFLAKVLGGAAWSLILKRWRT